MDKVLEKHALGSVWLALLDRLVTAGEEVGNEILEALNIYASFYSTDNDIVLSELASSENISEMRKVFFTREQNSFGHSYKDSIVGPLGRNDFQDVIDLLKENPDTKRALVTLVGNGKGKVPCINTVHFLVRKEGLIVNYFVRGQDVFNKYYADAIAISEMADLVGRGLNLKVHRVTSMISSAHIYLADLPKIREVLTLGRKYM